ncbi:LysR family transcriptional regulator [Roseivivax sediminis]|uniref:DNA-binding transcriptional regulator, LysR family n=1 Tax=Roseivivax sediminis TaxID=936889 RepID=A0A1I1XYQ9_9RHOB|nr:LysR family transcriptional regulator [Roseivivax sediminis]SFE12527.1 DNA-binding transcriptional regulator, LysR family [Roseivivax sediminis]
MSVEALRCLKYVLAAAEIGSMRRVAQTFGVRESTISRSIGAIERQLDMQIFQRGHSGVQLTDQGRDWVESVRGHYLGLEEALSNTARRNAESNRLHIGLSAPFGREFLIRLVDRFEKACPDIEVTIQDGSCRKQANAIRRRSLDLAFMCGSCDMRACQSETIWQERIAALLSADHHLAKKSSLIWRDLAGERLLVPQGADGPLLDPCLARQITACEQTPIIEQCRACQATVILKVQIGKGFTITGESFAKGLSVEGTVWRPVTGPHSIGVIKAVWLDSNPKRAVLRLLGMARNVAAERELALE